MKTKPANGQSQEKRWQQIRQRIEAAATHLRKQGTVMSKWARGRRVWVIRYRATVQGHQRYLSIFLGGNDQPELIRRARDLLAQLKEEGRWPAEIAAYARMAKAASAGMKRLLAMTGPCRDE